MTNSTKFSNMLADGDKGHIGLQGARGGIPTYCQNIKIKLIESAQDVFTKHQT